VRRSLALNQPPCRFTRRDAGALVQVLTHDYVKEKQPTGEKRGKNYCLYSSSLPVRLALQQPSRCSEIGLGSELWSSEFDSRLPDLQSLTIHCTEYVLMREEFGTLIPYFRSLHINGVSCSDLQLMMFSNRHKTTTNERRIEKIQG
jgi:hypothetical protein